MVDISEVFRFDIRGAITFEGYTRVNVNTGKAFVTAYPADVFIREVYAEVYSFTVVFILT